jgi:hypothetical protein
MFVPIVSVVRGSAYVARFLRYKVRRKLTADELK